MTIDHGMSAEEVLAVLDAVRSTGCRYWLEGGWGVDALVGRQTRPHRDVDVDVDAAHETAVLDALAHLGYVLETDWRPNRMELAAPGGRWVDLHPLVLDDEGGARQAARGGGWHEFPPHWADVPWTHGLGREVHGPGLDLLLAVSGRPAGVHALTGSGAGVLRERLPPR